MLLIYPLSAPIIQTNMIASTSANTIPLDDSYDQAKLASLKRQISLSKSQLFQLTNDDSKFGQKLKHFNHMGCESILKEQLYQAIIYLNEAEIILEYAANCGKTIERSLIITTLHNQACVYQRMWELEKAGDYIEGIIYNIISYLEGERIDLTDIESQGEEEYGRVSALMQNKLSLAAYYLQFCAVSSQNKNHENALSAAGKALDTLKEICEIEAKYEQMHIQSNGKPSLLVLLNKITNLKAELQDTQKSISKYLNEALKAIKLFHSASKTTLIDIDPKQKQDLIDFSIGNLMQINPMQIPETSDKNWLKQQFSPLKKIYKAIHISIAHFTMATELRLVAGDRYALDVASRKGSMEFKTSQLHHLISIITVALYVPYQTVYFEHILNSFKNHYQLDLAILSLECDEIEEKLEQKQIYPKKQHQKEEYKCIENAKQQGKQTKQTQDSINTMDIIKNKSLKRKLKMTTQKGGVIQSVTSIQIQKSTKKLPKTKKHKQYKDIKEEFIKKIKSPKQKKHKHQKDRLTATNKFQILVSPPMKNQSLTNTIQIVKSPKKPQSSSKPHKSRNSKSKTDNISMQRYKPTHQNTLKISHNNPYRQQKSRKGVASLHNNNLQSDTEYGLKKNGYYLGIMTRNNKNSKKSRDKKNANQKRSSKSTSKHDIKPSKTNKNPEDTSRQGK